MRVMTDAKDVSTFIHDFAIGLQQDPYSWRSWVAVHITSAQDEAKLDRYTQAYITHHLRAMQLGCHGAIVELPDDTLVMFIDNKAGHFVPRAFDELLNKVCSVAVPRLRLFVYRMPEQQNELLKFMQTHMHAMKHNVSPLPREADFFSMIAPEINNMAKVWAHACRQRTSRKKPHILVVDDDAVTRHVVSRALRSHYPVSTAACAEEAVHKHFLLGPDMVFLDIDLPDGNGLQLLQYIRGYDPHAQIIMFSSNSYLDNRIKALLHGANGFAGKPFQQADFDHYIDAWQPPYAKAIAQD